MTDSKKNFCAFVELFLLFLIGISGSNILHFGIEDYYHTNMIPSFFFGFEYALSQSVLIVFTLVYALFYMTRKAMIPDQDYYTERTKKNIFYLGVICMMSIFMYCCGVVYAYFSGQSQIGGLQRILVTMLFCGWGGLLCYHRVAQHGGLILRFSLLTEWFILIVLNAASLFVTLQFASPALRHSFEKDLNTLNQVKTASEAVQKYYKNNKKLPESFQQLKSHGYLNDLNIKSDTLKFVIKDAKTFSICETFSTNYNDFKRHNGKNFFFTQLLMTPPSNDLQIPFEKGQYCLSYQISTTEYAKGQALFLKGYSVPIQ